MGAWGYCSDPELREARVDAEGAADFRLAAMAISFSRWHGVRGSHVGLVRRDNKSGNTAEPTLQTVCRLNLAHADAIGQANTLRFGIQIARRSYIARFKSDERIA
jgi:hypothetical protein